MACPFVGLDPRGHDRVHQPGTVQMHGQVVLASPARDLRDAVDRVDSPAAAIVRVLQADQPGPDIMHVVRGPNAIAHIVQRQQAAVTLERPRRHARQPGDSAGLPDINVRRGRAQQLVARLCIDADADLVGHRARWHKNSRLLTQELGESWPRGA